MLAQRNQRYCLNASILDTTFDYADQGSTGPAFFKWGERRWRDNNPLEQFLFLSRTNQRSIPRRPCFQFASGWFWRWLWWQFPRWNLLSVEFITRTKLHQPYPTKSLNQVLLMNIVLMLLGKWWARCISWSYLNDWRGQAWKFSSFIWF